MVTEQQIKKIIFESLNAIIDSKMVPKSFEVNDDTVLIGMGGNLDSVSFVAFVTDVEEKIEEEIDQEFVIKLQEIHDLNEGKNALVVHDMSRLLTKIINKNKIHAKR